MNLGDKLGRYKIGKKIGSGGMGEVYIAEDEQLNRNVALKVLLSDFCSDAERVKRFKFEAKAVSAINHPNIITIHEIAEIDEKLFIATEFIDGVTLREKIEQKDLTVYESLKIAEQVADALSVAHKANIIHRDIKPENIMIRKDGYAKILDFGLAKSIFQTTSGAEDETIQMVKTQPGMVMGSVRYMSPEQARGKETDGRTDVWSLGVVLYEMLTGENPFEGETVSDSLAALIHKEPEPLEDIPEELGWVLNRCLNKNPDERYQDIKNLALDLRDLWLDFERNFSGQNKARFSNTRALAKQDTSENKTLIHQTISSENATDIRALRGDQTQKNSVSSKFKRSYLSIALIALLATFGLSAWYYQPSFLAAKRPTFDNISVSRLTDNGNANSAAVSPDGKLVAYIGSKNEKQNLIVEQIATGNSVEVVPETEKEFIQPTFSPDGNFIYFVTAERGIGTLNRVSSLGGQVKQIISDVDSRVSISADGEKLIFIRHNPNDGGDTVYVADKDGKNLKAFIGTKELGYNKFIDAIWINDDKNILLSARKSMDSQVGKTDLVNVEFISKKILDSDFTNTFNEFEWANANGFEWIKDNSGIVFIGRKKAEETMQIWHLDISSGVINSVTTDTSDYGTISISDDGKTLVATKGDWFFNLTSYSKAKNESKELIDESKSFIGYLGISETEDGKLIYSKMSGNELNLFSMQPENQVEKQITSENGHNLFPTSTPDGKYIVFSSTRNNSFGIWRMNFDGSDPKQLTKVQNGRDAHPQIINDGKTVVFVRQHNDGSKAELMKVSINGGNPEKLFADSQTSDMLPKVSPDGKYLAFSTFQYDEEKAEVKTSIKIAELNGDQAKLTDKKIDSELNKWFEWSPDSKFLTLVKKDSSMNLWNVSIDNDREIQLTTFNFGNIRSFTWSNDGKNLFLVRGNFTSDLVLIKDNKELG